MKRAVCGAVMAAAFAWTASSCSENQKATEACKDQVHNSPDCVACCRKNGAAGFKYASNTSCSCLKLIPGGQESAAPSAQETGTGSSDGP